MYVAVLFLSVMSSALYAESLNQASWVSGSSDYKFGHNSISNLNITGAPSDVDYTRSAMLHDGSTYRLYFFKLGTENKIYQFGWNGSSYQYGYNSIPELTITNIPADADTEKFSMLHDGSTYRLYMLSSTNTGMIYQFGWNGNSYEYGHNSIATMKVTGAPSDTNFDRFAMLHDGNDYRLYFGKGLLSNKLYQFAWDGETYDFDYNSIPELNLDSIPLSCSFDWFNMLHDGSDYRFYVASK